jgi:hypothetical protein
MTKEDFQELLIKLNACESGKEWAEGKTWEEFYNTCHRGDWLLWLFTRTNKNDLQLLTLTKGHCANTVRHLMTDERSIAAVDAAIAFGEGKITKKELDATANAAYDAANAADDAAYAASNAAYTTAKKENQQLTADIVRKYIKITDFNITLKRINMNDKQLQLCSFEQAKRLKNAGFDWEVQCYYKSKKNNVLFFGQSLVDHNVDDYDYSAPSVALALKWFRDVKGVVNAVNREEKDIGIIEYRGQFNDMYLTDFSFNTYESAESALLDELLTLIEIE